MGVGFRHLVHSGRSSNLDVDTFVRGCSTVALNTTRPTVTIGDLSYIVAKQSGSFVRTGLRLWVLTHAIIVANTGIDHSVL